MKAIITIVVLAAFCAMISNGFLFGHKFKNGCDPNPCKHKGECKLDAKNPNISTCICTGDYTGKHCEGKFGCLSKPCKKGNCTNDPTDLTKFVCKCEKGMVGEKCDTTDPCLKNPCKVGKCSADHKGKAVCSCPLGYGSDKCDKKNCTVVQFKGKNVEKHSPKLFVDKAFEAKLQKLDELAHLCKVKLHFTKGFILTPDPKALTYDFKDKTNPNHYIGQAVSIQIYDLNDKLLCNEICLGKIPIPVPEAKCLIDGLAAIQLKWSILDPTTIHSGYHVANIKNYNDAREAHQVGCRDTKF